MTENLTDATSSTNDAALAPRPRWPGALTPLLLAGFSLLLLYGGSHMPQPDYREGTNEALVGVCLIATLLAAIGFVYALSRGVYLAFKRRLGWLLATLLLLALGLNAAFTLLGFVMALMAAHTFA